MKRQHDRVKAGAPAATRGITGGAITRATGLVGAFLAGLAASPSSAQMLADEQFKVFEADLGPAWIDVSDYPAEQQQAYALFAQRCSKCHTLARPINSSLEPDQWVRYVNRMSRKPGSGIAPKEAEMIHAFLLFDAQKRTRKVGMDPELLPFMKVSKELSGVERFPACLRDIRPENDTLRVRVDGDPRLDLSRFVPSDPSQKLVKWSRRAPHQGEIVLVKAVGSDTPDADAPQRAGSSAVDAAAKEAVGAEKKPRERVELILDWLDEEMTREYVPGTGDVGALLTDRRGDATEFTLAFVAMARAAGIPARSRAGLVARRTAFYLHTWAEVWLNGWVPVDPYLGQLPADLTHMRLAGPDGKPSSDWAPGRIPGVERLQLRVTVPESAPVAEG